MIFSVLTVFPCLRTGPAGGGRPAGGVFGGGGSSPEIEALHENIRMENYFTVKEFRNRPRGGNEACLCHLRPPPLPPTPSLSLISLFALIHVCNSIVFNPVSPQAALSPSSQPLLMSGHVCYKRLECRYFPLSVFIESAAHIRGYDDECDDE